LSSIFISIASYRDPDIINTVKSCYDNAIDKNNLFFSIVSQGETEEHPNLSFIPHNQLSLVKHHWSESKGVCWARAIANKNINRDYFLQIDSHSRFIEGWDKIIISNYEKAKSFWGSRLILTNYPDMFIINWETNPPSDEFKGYEELKSIKVTWDNEDIMPKSHNEWPNVIDKINGDEHGFFAAGSVFCSSFLMKEIPYDENIYFIGEEASMAIRAYTRGIRLVSPTVKYMFTNYDRENSKRQLHWQNNISWSELNQSSYKRLEKIMKGDKTMGIFGIDSESLYHQYKKFLSLKFKN